VLLGLLADAPGLGIAFLLPAALLVPVLFVARRFRAPVAADTALLSVVSDGDAPASVDR